MPWGVIGPATITYYSNQLKLNSLLQKIDVLYPIHVGTIVSYLTDPELNVKELITHRTKCIHLYNEVVKNVDLKSLDENSILGKMLRNDI